jgi:deoxyribodipyrimidine photolyase
MSTEDTVQRLMGLADEFARAAGYVVSSQEREAAELDARSTLESALREALTELRRLSAENPVLHDCIESLKSDLAERDAEIALLRADARRWRWVRDHAYESDNIKFSFNDGRTSYWLEGEHGEAVIDAAMKDTP